MLFRRLKKLGWPKEGYTILCWNCNFSTKHGVPCMHKKEYSNYEKQMNNESIRFNKNNEYIELKNQLEEMNK